MLQRQRIFLVCLLLLSSQVLSQGPTASLPVTPEAAEKLTTCLLLNGIPRTQITTQTDFGFTAALNNALIQDPVATPTVIARPKTSLEVAVGVQCARIADVKTCPRSGGHSWSSSSTCPGLLIDLQLLDTVKIERGGLLVTVGAGNTVGQAFYDIYQATGRAILTGTCPSIGISGFVLGGGRGPLSGEEGLASDLVTSMVVVTPDARVRTVSAINERSLYWALRGGGGGLLGIVTEFTLATVQGTGKYDNNCYFSYTWPDESAAQAILEWTRYTDQNFTGVYIRMGISGTSSGVSARASGVCWQVTSVTECRDLLSAFSLWTVAGRVEEVMERSSEGVLEALKFFSSAGRFGNEKPSGPTKEAFYEQFVSKLTLEDRSWSSTMWNFRKGRGPTLGYYQRLLDIISTENEFLGDDKAIGIGLYPVGDRIRRSPGSTSAYPHRRQTAIMAFFYRGGASKSDRLASKARIQRYLTPFRQGTYLNYQDIDLPNYAREYWGQSLGRMRGLKRQYDRDELLWTVQPL